jgi:hypothetical protein
MLAAFGVALLSMACSSTSPPSTATPSGASIAPAAPGTTAGTTAPTTAPGTTAPATEPPTSTTELPTTTTSTVPATTTTIPCTQIHVVCPPEGGIPPTTFGPPQVTATVNAVDIYNGMCGPKSGYDEQAFFNVLTTVAVDQVRIAWNIEGVDGVLAGTPVPSIDGRPNPAVSFTATFNAAQSASHITAASQRVDFTVTATNRAGTGTAHVLITLWRCGGSLTP